MRKAQKQQVEELVLQMQEAQDQIKNISNNKIFHMQCSS